MFLYQKKKKCLNRRRKVRNYLIVQNLLFTKQWTFLKSISTCSPGMMRLKLRDLSLWDFIFKTETIMLSNGMEKDREDNERGIVTGVFEADVQPTALVVRGEHGRVSAAHRQWLSGRLTVKQNVVSGALWGLSRQAAHQGYTKNTKILQSTISSSFRKIWVSPSCLLVSRCRRRLSTLSFKNSFVLEPPKGMPVPMTLASIFSCWETELRGGSFDSFLSCISGNWTWDLMAKVTKMIHFGYFEMSIC